MGFLDNSNNKAWVHNDLIVGIIGREEYLGLYNKDQIKNKEDIVLISIGEPGGYDHPDFKVEGFHDVLQMKFWDIEEDFASYKILTDEDGKQMKEFILKNKDKQFLIHCAAGISRSAGVGRAVECLINHDGNTYNYLTSESDITAHYRYSPNHTVFSKILGIDPYKEVTE